MKKNDLNEIIIDMRWPIRLKIFEKKQEDLVPWESTEGSFQINDSLLVPSLVQRAFRFKNQFENPSGNLYNRFS